MSLFSKSSEIENLLVDSLICFLLNDLGMSIRYERKKNSKLQKIFNEKHTTSLSQICQTDLSLSFVYLL